MNRAAFTMIELIFVIVILGILAILAIPKLAATRDDAAIAAQITAGSQAISNLGAEFTAQGAFNNYTLADAAAEATCFSFTAGANPGEVVVAVTAAAPCDNITVATAVTTRATANGLIGTHSFGGNGVVW